MRHLFRKLRKDQRGATAVEFAIIGPAVLTLMVGVLQVGIGMQAYNALRSVAMDTARYAAVEYQKDETLSNDQITTWAQARAVDAPYLLSANNIVVTTTTPATQRVTGAAERTLTIRYTVPSLLAIVGLRDFEISYSRPIFVPL